MINKVISIIKEEKAQALILVAAGMFVFVGLAAFTTDYGIIKWQHRVLQNVADSAALAGASKLPVDYEVDKEASTYIDLYFEGKEKGDLETTIRLQNNKKEVKVDIANKYNRYFGLIFGNEKYEVSKSATAEKYSEWDGEALPFVNLDDDYSINPKIEAWEKTGTGTFESIWGDPDYKPNKNPPQDYRLYFGDFIDKDKTYFTVDWQDGITVTNGTVANIKQEIGYIFEQNKPVYIFSLASKVINDGDYNGVGNKDVISRADLVLLKVTFDSYDYTGKTLYLTVTDVFDLGNEDLGLDLPDFPDETVRLIK